MPDLFGSAAMAAGYARARPPLHARIVEMAWRRLGRTEAVERALDVGCGSGLSTAPLQRIARRCFGLDPNAAMVRWAGVTAPGAVFAAAAAEALPVASHSIDLITAAGSLNYADPDRAFPEAVRVLRPGGALVVYDFSQGRSFAGSPDLDRWFEEFRRRYPAPRGDARTLDPAILAGLATGLDPGESDHFEIGLPLTPEFYVDYAMTETNVALAVANGTPAAEIRAWCEASVAAAFRGETREVRFRGYWACLLRN